MARFPHAGDDDAAGGRREKIAQSQEFGSEGRREFGDAPRLEREDFLCDLKPVRHVTLPFHGSCSFETPARRALAGTRLRRHHSPVVRQPADRSEEPLLAQSASPVVTLTLGARSIAIANHLPLTIIAGPCALESRSHALETAAALKEITDSLGAALIYKTSFDKANRTSAVSGRGLGIAAALPIFAEIRERLGTPVVTDVHEAAQCAPVAEAVDVLQIPAFLCRQTDLLEAAGRTGRIVKIKKGQFLAPWDMKNVVAKVVGTGNARVLVTERGASFGYNTLVSDFRSLPIMARETGAPVVFDATHSVQQPGGRGATSGGDREFVPTLARAAAAVGIAALFAETHPDPDKAPSDGPNMVPMRLFKTFLEEILAIDRLAKARPSLHGFS
ncbi:MAG: 3-deoxy-8-phosphooctulonate synthase [Parvularculaceae bacterium]|nr:3-deoxy-8-phosphooctulonate synthase [Parvularculaceae bacterium]